MPTDAELKTPEIDAATEGWAAMPDEASWFVYDFFVHKLNPYDKLLFFGYFIQGFTLVELADRFHCTFQRAQQMVVKLEKKLHNAWNKKNKKGHKNDSKPRNQ